MGISASSSIHWPVHTVWTVSSRWRSTAMCSCPLMVVSTGCRLPSSAPPAPSLSPISPSIGRTAPSSSSETDDGVGGGGLQGASCSRMGLGRGGRPASEAPQGRVAWIHHLCLLLNPPTYPPLLQLPAWVPREDTNVLSMWVRISGYAWIHVEP